MKAKIILLGKEKKFWAIVKKIFVKLDFYY